MQVASRTTLTIDRIKRILTDELWVQDKNIKSIPRPFRPLLLHIEKKEDGTLSTWSDLRNQRKRVANLFRTYLEQPSDSAQYLEGLDGIHLALLKCEFRPTPDDNIDDITARVHNVLKRLPLTPPPPGSSRIDLSALQATHFASDTTRNWDNLHAARFLDSNLIRVAIWMELEGSGATAHDCSLYIQAIARLAEASFNYPPKDPSVFILRAFLWTSWQNTITLQFHQLLGTQLNYGYNLDSNSALIVVGMRDLEDAAKERERLGPPAGTQYMCSWAMKLLQSDRTSINSDLRVFYQRFSEVFGQDLPRCIKRDGLLTQCTGNGPYDCMRFRGMTINDQSAHAAPCLGGCKRLFWSEVSYREEHGPRAVSLNDTGSGAIKYCSATNRTMAISHVWSHGQGGRPEEPARGGTGFNECLHRRYEAIARKFGCDSYWMDTPCIPQDHKLRKEAIANINKIFATSKLTLVCDRDIMAIDCSRLDVDRLERILAILLVCDWNLRSWTLLEAVRGRKNIVLLGKNQSTVSVRDILIKVHGSGNISLSNLFVTAHHLLPAPPEREGMTEARLADMRQCMSVEEATCLLSHRHASRPGDEVVIWSLLCGDTPSYNAADFWTSRSRKELQTGLLVCQNPRLQQPGLTWAPERPDFPEQAYRKYGKGLLYPDVGTRTSVGDFMGDGFRAMWHLCEVKGDPVSSREKDRGAVGMFQSLEDQERAFTNIAERYLEKDRWGALLTPEISYTSYPKVPVVYRDSSGQPFFVVVGTNDETKYKWRWRGIFPWPHSSLPSFSEKAVEILLF